MLVEQSLLVLAIEVGMVAETEQVSQEVTPGNMNKK